MTVLWQVLLLYYTYLIVPDSLDADVIKLLYTDNFPRFMAEITFRNP